MTYGAGDIIITNNTIDLVLGGKVITQMIKARDGGYYHPDRDEYRPTPDLALAYMRWLRG